MLDGPSLPLPGLTRVAEPDEVVDPELVEGASLTFTVPGKPQGAKRPHVVRNRHTGQPMALTPDSHVEHEERIRMAAELAQGGPLGGWSPLEGAVAVELTTWHRRPGRLRKVAHRGTGIVAFTGKPDADNIAKLAMDAMSRAGTYRDDTQVADLTVRRRWLPLDLEGNDIGLERTEVRVVDLGGAS